MLQRGDYGGGHGRYACYDTITEPGAMIDLPEFDTDKAPRG